MPRKYIKIKELEPQILAMRAEGKTCGETAKSLGLEKKKIVNWVIWYNHEQARREAERGQHYYRQRICTICGNPYWPESSRSKFCSDACRKKNHNKVTLEAYHKKRVKEQTL